MPKIICREGKYYEKVAFCLFVGAKVEVILCSNISDKQSNIVAKSTSYIGPRVSEHCL